MCFGLVGAPLPPAQRVQRHDLGSPRACSSGGMTSTPALPLHHRHRGRHCHAAVLGRGCAGATAAPPPRQLAVAQPGRAAEKTAEPVVPTRGQG
jgi:hypothetical protein